MEIRIGAVKILDGQSGNHTYRNLVEVIVDCGDVVEVGDTQEIVRNEIASGDQGGHKGESHALPS